MRAGTLPIKSHAHDHRKTVEFDWSLSSTLLLVRYWHEKYYCRLKSESEGSAECTLRAAETAEASLAIIMRDLASLQKNSGKAQMSDPWPAC